jgi:hypothetical protein
MGIKFTNNASGELAVSITDAQTTLVLAAGQGSKFPTLGAQDYFYATLVNPSNELEIVKVTARTTDTLTVIRAQAGTTARAYEAGDRLELRLVAAAFDDITGETNVALALKAPIESPTFTGIPSGPTAAPGTSTTQLATTQFVQAVAGNLGSMAIQNADNVSITGGSITGITPLAIASGGTGSNSAANARAALLVPSRSGEGASGTWQISITGNAQTATSATTATKLSTASGNAPSYSARAWVVFNGQTSPAQVLAAANVISITDISYAQYRINFITAMQDANYVIVSATYALDPEDQAVVANTELPTSTGYRLKTGYRNILETRARVYSAVIR